MPNPEDRYTNEEDPSRVSPVLPFVVFVILAAIGLGYFFFWHERPSPDIDEIPVATPAPTPVPARPTPLPTATPTPQPQATPEPLPDLDSSDAPLRDKLNERGLADMLAYLTPEEVVRKTVRAVYNLSKGNVVQQYRPVQGPESVFTASATGATATIENPKKKGEKTETAVYRLNSKNSERYALFINLLRGLDRDVVVDLYQLYYPLLQQAYGELGEGPEEFHTVVLQALDSFLAAPQPSDEPLLIRTSVHYQFLKPEYQALPATQKLMLRMGKQNRRVLHEELQSLRAALAQATVSES